MPYEDDASIEATTRLFRRVHPHFIVRDKNRDCMRLASGAFTDAELSVDIEDSLDGRDPRSLLEGHADHALVAFPTQSARDLQQVVCRDPEGGGESHGLVVGKKTPSRQRALARASEWVSAPDGACHPPAA